MNELRERVAAEVARVVVDSGEVVDVLLGALILGGHVLLHGPPGVAKTLTASAFARAVGGDFRRVQFTPDMAPADLIGGLTFHDGEPEFRPGPVFTNVLLADEINRTPPKTQAALLEAMQEGQASVAGVTHPLPSPFLVTATQSTVEFDGTYPLPPTQLDRFLMRIEIGYPSEEHELELLALPRAGLRDLGLEQVRTVLADGELAQAGQLVEATTVSAEVAAYIVALVRQTRALPSILLGASPRATVHLQAVARVVARYAGRDFVTPEDVGRAAPYVLPHRLLLSPDAELGRYTTTDALTAALATVPAPR